MTFNCYHLGKIFIVMAIGYYFGKTLVQPNEIIEKQAMGIFSKFEKSVSKIGKGKIEFKNGVFESRSKVSRNTLKVAERTPVGIGKPLSIEILCVYTGDAPNNFFGGRKDILVVSGVKDVRTHGHFSKAINMIASKEKDFSRIHPSGTSGAPLVYYTPSLDVGTVFCQIEMIADTFNEKTFEKIEDAFKQAASIPLFFKGERLLQSGATILKIGKKLGSKYLESKPFLNGEIEIRFDTPGVPIFMSDCFIVYNDGRHNQFQNYSPGLIGKGANQKLALVHDKNGEEYKGEEPYILVNIDGRNRDQDFKDFTPKAITAAFSEKYYGSGSSTSKTEILEEALMLLNDKTYYTKAKEAKELLKKLVPNSNEYKNTKKLIEAYIANIQSEFFKK